MCVRRRRRRLAPARKHSRCLCDSLNRLAGFSSATELGCLINLHGATHLHRAMGIASAAPPRLMSSVFAPAAAQTAMEQEELRS